MKNLVRKILKHGDTWTAPANVRQVKATVIACRGSTFGNAGWAASPVALTLTGDAYAWGSAATGMLGNGTTTPDQTTPALVLGGYKWVSVCLATGIDVNGDMYAWGESDNGRLGNGTTTPDQTTPSLVLGGHKWVLVDAGGAFRVGITIDGAAYAWGAAGSGRLGNDTTTPDQTTPSLVNGGHTWKSVACGTQHTVGIVANGDAYAWGLATSGQLGNGTSTPNQTTPSLVLGGHKWAVVKAGGSSSAGITKTGDAYAWGAGGSGQLGDGGTSAQVTPSLVLGGHKWVDIAVGSTHMIGITEDGDAYAWGRATDGELGNGTTTPNQTTPVLVLGGHKWVSVTAGNDFSGGITTTGEIYTWGDAGSGRLGNGTTTPNQTTPVLVLGGHTWANILKTRMETTVVKVNPGTSYAARVLPWSVALGGNAIYQTSDRGFWVELELEYEA